MYVQCYSAQFSSVSGGVVVYLVGGSIAADGG